MSVVPVSDLPQLWLWLRQSLPKSFMIFEQLDTTLAYKWSDMEFVVDNWPNPQAVIRRIVSSDTECDWNGFLSKTIVGYGDSDDALTGLLKTPGVIDWNKQFVFKGVRDSCWPMISGIAREKGSECHLRRVYALLKGTREDVKPLPLPDGMKLVKVTEEMADKINSTWKYADKGSDKFIRSLVRSFPSLALLSDRGQHIGHMVGRSPQSMGFLYVQPEFRGRGFGKIITSNLAQKYFDVADDVYMFVESTNLPSLKLHEAVGFQTVPGASYPEIVVEKPIE